RLPRQRGQIRADRRILRPPRRVALVRPQRGAWPALLLSRLEIRRDRPVHRRPLRAARERLLPEDQAQVLPVGEARAGAVDLYGPARQAAAAAGMGIRDGAGRSDLHLQAPAGMQLAASHGGWDRFEPCLLPAPPRSVLRSDPLFKGAKGNEYNLSDMQPYFEVVEQPGGLYIGARRNAENGNYYWRITPWVMPCFTMIPPRGDHPIHGHFWIPIDDENC